MSIPYMKFFFMNIAYMKYLIFIDDYLCLRSIKISYFKDIITNFMLNPKEFF